MIIEVVERINKVYHVEVDSLEDYLNHKWDYDDIVCEYDDEVISTDYRIIYNEGD